MSSFLGQGRNRYSVEKLQNLHAELLDCMDIDIDTSSSTSTSMSTSTSSSTLEQKSNNENNDDAKRGFGLFWKRNANIGNEGNGDRNNNNNFRKKLSVSRRLRFATFIRGIVSEGTLNSGVLDMNDENKGKDLEAAFRFLSATRSPDREGDNFGAAALRDEASNSTLAMAKSIEETVSKVIRDIGEVVVNGDTADPSNTTTVIGASPFISLRCDPVFEYFCEHNLLSLLVDIATENPGDRDRTNERRRIRHKSRICDDDDIDSQEDEDSTSLSGPKADLGPGQEQTTESTTEPGPVIGSMFHGAVWCPLVKAQVLQTISLFISGVRNPSVLFYVLSQNCINHLILSMLPINQWTDPALDRIMPAYVDVLKNLTAQLTANPRTLFPFFVINNYSFPLFQAILETVTSSFAQTDTYVHSSCLKMMITILRITYRPMRIWLSKAQYDQRFLSEHMCHLILNRFQRIANLTNGPVVDGIRSNAIAAQLQGLDAQIDVLDDVFHCQISQLNVRLCEALLRIVISDFLKHLLPRYRHSEINVITSLGVMDIDVIPSKESHAQVALLCLSRIFLRMEYKPFVRMIAVSLFHPNSTTLWDQSTNNTKDNANENNKDYILMPALDAIAQEHYTERREGKPTTNDDDNVTGDHQKQQQERLDIIPNPYRHELIKTLRGDYGHWRAIPAAILLEGAIQSDALDIDTLIALQIIRCVNTKKISVYSATTLEVAVVTFLEKHHLYVSTISRYSLECAGSLALQLFYVSAMANTEKGRNCCRFNILFTTHPLYKALLNTASYFCQSSLEAQNMIGVSDIFVDLIESEILNRYKKITIASMTTSSSSFSYYGRTAVQQYYHTQHPIFALLLTQKGCSKLGYSPDILIRRFRSVDPNDVETTRFNIQMALHFKALTKALQKFGFKMRTFNNTYEHNNSNLSNNNNNNNHYNNNILLDMIDEADDLILTVGGLKEKPAVGTDLDLKGRMTFRCFSVVCNKNSNKNHNPTTASPKDSNARSRTLSEDMIFRPGSTDNLILVLDPTDMFVVKPLGRGNGNDIYRGTVICRISLQCVIAAATDSDWLHIAVRHEDVGFLVKNGNMALRFDNPGTSLVVRQYLERCRNFLRRELMEKARDLLGSDAYNTTSSSVTTTKNEDDSKKYAMANTAAMESSTMDEKKVEEVLQQSVSV